MTTAEKLQQMYKIKNDLHPLTMVLIVGFVETQKSKMGPHDEQFVEEMFPLYFKENGERVYGKT